MFSIIRKEEEHSKHSTPAVFVQVPDIGYGTPGIVIYCNKPSHKECCKELANILQHGGFLVRTSYWGDYYRRLKEIRAAIAKAKGEA